MNVPVSPCGGLHRLPLLGALLATALFAQTTPPPASTDQGPPAAAANDPSGRKDEEVVKLDAFKVTATGTNIRGVEPTGTAVLQMTRPEIISTGAATTEMLLKTNPAISNFQALFPGNGDAGGSVAPSIHGVAEGETLVLINGHRLPGSGFLVTASDPSAISQAAIERVDVIPDGASAIYGSDAIEGVINIILRKDFKGAETSVRYGVGDHYSNYNVDAVAGSTWTGGSLFFAYEFSHSSALSGADRSYYRQNRSALGGSDARNVTTGRVVDSTGAVLAAGTRVDVAPYFDAVPETKRHNAVAAFNQKLGDALSVYAEAYFEKRQANWQVPLSALTVSVPTTNPYVAAAGYGAAKGPLTVTYFPGTTGNTSGAEVYSTSAGGKLKLPHDWALSLDNTYGWSNSNAFFPDVNGSVAQTLASGTTTATALNPFGASPGSVFSQVLSYANVEPHVKQDLFDTSLKADGSLVTLPAGELKAALGIGYRSENYQASNVSGTLSNPLVGRADVSRNVSSAFAELLVPVIGQPNELPAVRRLSLSLSGRHDHYSDFGNTTNPKIGVTWSLVRSFDLRGSWGTSFHAPRLSDIGTGVDTRLIPLPFYLFGNNYPSVFTAPPSNMVIIAGGTNGLKPEKANTWSVGFDFKPVAISGLTVSATYYNILFKDNVGVVFLPNFTNPGDAKFWKANLTAAETQALYATYPLIPGASYPTQIAYLADVRRFNLGKTWTNGVDTDVRYRWKALGGNVEAGIGANVITSYRLQQTQGSPIVSYLGTNRAVRSKVRSHLSWNRGQYTASLMVNRTDNYRDTNTTGMPVNPYTTVDLHLGYDFKAGGWLRDASVSLDVTNLLDSDPPFVDASNDNRTSAGTGVFGYDQNNASPIGRVVSVTLRKRF